MTKKFVSWLGFVFFFYSFLVYLPGITSFCFLAVSILLFPPLTSWLDNKDKLPDFLARLAFGFAILVVGMFFLPG